MCECEWTKENLVESEEVRRELKRWLPLLLYEAAASLERGSVEDCVRVAHQLTIYVVGTPSCDEKNVFRCIISALMARASMLQGDLRRARAYAHKAESLQKYLERLGNSEILDAVRRALAEVRSRLAED